MLLLTYYTFPLYVFIVIIVGASLVSPFCVDILVVDCSPFLLRISPTSFLDSPLAHFLLLTRLGASDCQAPSPAAGLRVTGIDDSSFESHVGCILFYNNFRLSAIECTIYIVVVQLGSFHRFNMGPRGHFLFVFLCYLKRFFPCFAADVS